MNTEIILNQIPFRIDLPALMQKLHIKEDGQYAQELRQLAEEAQTIAHPRAVYKEAYVTKREKAGVMIDGQSFNSRVLRINFDEVQRVFPYVATCGAELDGWQKNTKDALRYFWSDTIKELALMAAEQALEKQLIEQYDLEGIAAMNPGSLEDWPLPEQRPLFDLIGDPQAAIGVELTGNYLMLPLKSSSGIRFPSKEGFTSCQLCRRENCPSRRMAFEKTLFETKFQSNIA